VLADELTVAVVVVLFTVRVALLTVRVWTLDMPPPGVGLNTVILLAPAVVRSLAGIVPVSWVELTKVVVEPLLGIRTRAVLLFLHLGWGMMITTDSVEG